MPYQRTKRLALGVKATFPGFVPPALATKIDQPPAGDRWLHEIKFDGYRVQLHIVNGDIKCSRGAATIGRSGFARSRRMRMWSMPKSAIIDGEIVVPAADGTTDFSVLQNELKGTSDKIVMVAFDLLYLNGEDVRNSRSLSARHSCKS